MTDVETYSMDQLIPQKRVMRLVDTLTNYGEGFVECAVNIKSDGLFLVENCVPSWVGVEYMAQTVAAYIGIQQVKGGVAPGIGLLIGIRNYRVETDHFDVGTTLKIRAEEEYRDQQMGVYNCTIRNKQGDLVASANLKGAISP